MGILTGKSGGYELDLLLAPKGKEAIAPSDMWGFLSVYFVLLLRLFGRKTGGLGGGKEAARHG